MEHTSVSSQDATCYESRITHPTDVKLLWQCCNETYLQLNNLRKTAKLRPSRINYDKYKLNVLSKAEKENKTPGKKTAQTECVDRFAHQQLDQGNEQ